MVPVSEQWPESSAPKPPTPDIKVNATFLVDADSGIAQW